MREACDVQQMLCQSNTSEGSVLGCAAFHALQDSGNSGGRIKRHLTTLSSTLTRGIGGCSPLVYRAFMASNSAEKKSKAASLGLNDACCCERRAGPGLAPRRGDGLGGGPGNEGSAEGRAGGPGRAIGGEREALTGGGRVSEDGNGVVIACLGLHNVNASW